MQMLYWCTVFQIKSFVVESVIFSPNGYFTVLEIQEINLNFNVFTFPTSILYFWKLCVVDYADTNGKHWCFNKVNLKYVLRYLDQ